MWTTYNVLWAGPHVGPMNFAIWVAAASLYISVMIKLCGTNWTKYIDGLVQERRNPISNARYLEYAICAASLHIRSQSM